MALPALQAPMALNYLPLIEPIINYTVWHIILRSAQMSNPCPDTFNRVACCVVEQEALPWHHHTYGLII